MKKFKSILSRLFSFTLITALFAYLAFTPILVNAQEAIPAPTEARSATPAPTEAPTPTPTPTPTPDSVTTNGEFCAEVITFACEDANPTNCQNYPTSCLPAGWSVSATPQPSATPSPSATPTSSATPSPAPTPAPSNNINVPQVSVGTTYDGPSGSNVKVKFNSVTGSAGSLTISQSTLTSDQVTQVGALSSAVYDISSSMPNGTFTYDLTLPLPSGVTVANLKVLYASSLDNLGSATQVSQSIVDNGDGTFTIQNLNHFTIFVVVNPNSQANCDGVTVGTTPGTTCFTTIQAAVNAASNGDTINVGSTGSPYNETVYVNKQLTFTGSGNPSVTAFVLQKTPVTITGITTSVSIATPTVSLTNPVNSGNQITTAISGTGAANATVNYTITGTSGSVTGTGTVSSGGVISITNINVSSLPDGALTLTVYLTSGSYSSSNATAAAFKDTVAPSQASGLTITNPVNNSNKTSISISGTAEAGATVNWTISNSGTSVSGSTTATAGGTFSVTGINVTTLPDGTLTLTVTTTDSAGNTSSNATTTATKDVVAPTVNTGSTTNARVTFTTSATASDSSPSSGIASYAWTKQSGSGTITFGSASSLNTTISASTDGAYVIQLVVTDNAGNSTTSTFTLNWDTQAPSVNAGTTPQNKNATFTQNATVTDPSPSSGGLVYSWTRQSGPGTITFGSPSTEDTTVSASAEGTYVLRLTVTDAAGNSAFGEVTLNWDTTAPTVSAGSAPTPKNAIFTQVGSASDSLSGVASVAWTQVSGPGTVTFGSASATTTTISANADGTYVIRLTATDNAGNSANSTVTFVWDTTNPTVSAGSNPSPKNATFTQIGSASDATSGLASTTWTQVSGPGTVTFGTASSTTTTVSANADGTYVIRLTAVDNAGNSANSTVTFVWDVTNPTVNAGSTTNARTTFTTSATASDATSGIASYSWTMVSGPGSITFGSASVLNTTISASTDGAYVVQLTVTDNAGNSANSSFTLNWDTVAPTVSAGSYTPKNATFTTTATAPDPSPSSGIATYAWTQVSGPGSITFGSSSALNTTVSASVDGTYTIRLTVTDSAGNSANSTTTFVWDVTNPTVSAGSAPTPKNAIFTQVGSASDVTSGLASTTWTQVSGPGTVTFGNSTATTTTVSANADGTYVIRLTAVDNAGNSASSTVTFVWDTTSPTVSAGTTPQNKNATFTQTGSASDATSGIASVSWTMVSGPGSITFGSTNSVTTTVSASVDGTYVIRLTAIDNAGNSANSTFTLNWDTVTPTVSAGSNVATNTTYTTSSTVSDPSPSSGGLTYQWSMVSGPSGGVLTFGTATSQNTTISANVDGAYVVRLTVTDAANNSNSSTFTLTWDTVAPTVNAGSNTARNAIFTTSSTVTDTSPTSGIASYTWSMVSGPGTITFGTANAQNTTITASTDGVYVVRLTVADNAGNSNNSSFTLTWDTTAPTVSAGSTPTPKNATFTQVGSASDGGSGINTIFWTQVSGSGTVTFGSPSATTTTVSANTDGSYTIRLTVTDLAGNSNNSTVTFTWDTTNPTVSAGTNPTPKNSTFTQVGSASDAISGIASVLWTQVSGSGTVTFGSATSTTTTISANADGVYVVRLTATDNAGNSSNSTITFTWDTTNPTVSAGTYTPKNSVFTTTATATDATSGIATYAWTQISGPGTITFGTSSALNTTVFTSADGTYVIRLTVVDNAGNSNFSNSTFVWDTTNPTVSAGTTPTLKNAVFTQVGSASDATAGIASTTWTQVSGPGTITFGTPTATTTTVSASTDGTYVIRLTATDNAGNTTTSTVTFTWDSTAPTASWTTPTASSTVSGNVTLTATASDTNGVASVLFAYKRNNGVDTFHTIATVTSSPYTTSWDTNSLALDTYTLRITVTDSAANTTNVDQNVDVSTVISSGSITSGSITSSGVVITWTTDDLTSSRVIYDTVSHPTLGSAPNYSYANSTANFDTSPKVLNHSVTLSGLTGGTTYYYRTVSAGSPEAVSSEFSFTTSASTQQAHGALEPIHVLYNTKAPVCGDIKPGSAPALLSAIVKGNKVVLTWNKAKDPLTYYLIEYGTGHDKYQFGVPNVGNVTEYEIGDLEPGVTYYFRVRAGNNCMPGEFSNELTAKTGQSTAYAISQAVVENVSRVFGATDIQASGLSQDELNLGSEATFSSQTEESASSTVSPSPVASVKTGKSNGLRNILVLAGLVILGAGVVTYYRSIQKKL